MLTINPVVEALSPLKNGNDQNGQGDFAPILEILVGLGSPPLLEYGALSESLPDLQVDDDKEQLSDLSGLQPMSMLQPELLQELNIRSNNTPVPSALTAKSTLISPALSASRPILSTLHSSNVANDASPAAAELASKSMTPMERTQSCPQQTATQSTLVPENDSSDTPPDMRFEELTVIAEGRIFERDVDRLATSGLLLSSTSTARSTVVDTASFSTFTLASEVGTSVWQQSLSQQLAIFTRDGVHNAELRLNPAELGTLKIHLQVKNDVANLHVVTENQQVRNALEAALPCLKSSLAESGLQLSMTSSGSDFAHSWNESRHSGKNEADPFGKDEHECSVQGPEKIIEMRADPMRLNVGINTFV